MKAENVLTYFREISKIPRVSHHCEKIADYLESFAKERALYCRRDGANNVIIVKPAAAGREDDAAVMLQGHVDMVGEKLSNICHDFLRDPITLIEEGDTLRADGTTLGGDDGAAVAIMLALLDDKTLCAPRLECVFTTDEEVGMLGADVIDLDGMQAKYLINADSEDEGVFTCGCCGGTSLDFTIPVSRAAAVSKDDCIAVALTGLKGGHSGTEINNGRLNAIKLLAELLEPECGIISIERDGKDNAIPQRCDAVISASKDAVLKNFVRLREEWSHTEPDIALEIFPAADLSPEALPSSVCPMTAESAGRILTFLKEVPFGVRKMCAEPAGLVHTSDNIGILKTDKDSVSGTLSVRSVSAEDKDALCREIEELCGTAGGSTVSHGNYPGWEYRENSKLRRVMCEVWEDMYGTAPKIDVIHAGLECGVILSKMPGLDIVSIGPELHDIHTAHESMSISSLGRCADFIVRVLEVIK